MKVQHLYIPALASVRARLSRENGGDQTAAFDIELFLPSAVLEHIRCPQRLLSCEWRLRYARAFHYLDDLRGLLLIRSCLYKEKDRQITGQRLLTRSRAIISSVSTKVNAAVARYRHTRSALAKLAPPLLHLTWDVELRELADSDIVGLSWMDAEGAEGRRTLTWIWRIHGSVSGDVDERTREGQYRFCTDALCLR